MASNQVHQHKQLAKLCLSGVVGGVAAAFAAPVLFGTLLVTSPALIASVGCSVGAGAIGSAVARVTHNISDADPVQYMLTSPNVAQATFRDALLQYLGSRLEGLYLSIRRNRPRDVFGSLPLNSSTHAVFTPFENVWVGELQYDLVLRYKIKIEPQTNTPPRALEEGVEPRPLPVHIGPHTTERYVLPRASHEWSDRVVRSAVFGGLLGGALGGAGDTFLPQAARGFHFFHTVPNSNMGVVLGIPTAAGITGAATQVIGRIDTQDSVTQMILLFNEMTKHFDRLIDCAEMNDVKIKVEAVCGYRSVERINTPALMLESDMSCGFDFKNMSGF